MKIARRGFLKALPAFGLGARAAAEEASAALAGLGTPLGLSAGRVSSGGSAGLSQTTGQLPSLDFEEPWYLKALKALRAVGIPEWRDAELREQAWHVGHLDPDIAVKRSWSLAVKIQTQRERNYQQLRAGIFRRLEREDASARFAAKHGPWL